MINIVKALGAGVGSLAFPNVCICCGLETTQEKRHLCSFCREERFVDANPDNKLAGRDVILPEGIVLQHALWKMDKGGVLQNLMYQLKYERLTDIGVELGFLLAVRAYRHPSIAPYIDAGEALLLPVPLHHRKFRSRGFNQSFFIARGISRHTGLTICSRDAVVRRENTGSQTGFSLQRRIANVKGAFRIRRQEVIEKKTVIIVDDVFTTGSTTFELAGALKRAGAGEVLILTVAQV